MSLGRLVARWELTVGISRLQSQGSCTVGGHPPSEDLSSKFSVGIVEVCGLLAFGHCLLRATLGANL